MADGLISIKVTLDDGNVVEGVADLTKQFDKLGEAPKKATVSIGSLVKSMGLMKLASSAFNVLKSSMDSAISRFDTMQKFPKVMTALGFTSEQSEKSIKKLGDGIDGLPTKLDDVVSSTQQLTAITGDLDKSTDTVLALNNAFLASGASSEDASRGLDQYRQMLSAGEVDLESWKTLQETMPLALQKTAEAMGFTGKSAQRDLYSALKDGTVVFDDFNDKIIELGTGQGMFVDLARKNSEGIATSFGNIRNAVAKNVANIITKVDELSQALTGNTIAGHLDSVKYLVNDFFGWVIGAMDLLPGLFNSIGSELEQNPVIHVIKMWVDIWGKQLMEIVNIVSSYVPAIIEWFVNLYMELEPYITTAVYAVGRLQSAFIEFYKENLPGIMELGAKAFQAFREVAQPILETLLDAITDFANGASEFITGTALPAFQKFLDYLNNNENTIEAFKAVLQGLLVGFLAFKLITTIVAVVGAVGKAFAILKGVVSALSTAQGILNAVMMANPFVLIAVAIGVLVAGFIYLWNTSEGFRAFWINLWQGIKDVASGLWESVKGAWSSMLQGFKDIAQGIEDAWGSTIQWIKDAWSSVGKWFSDIGQSIKDAWDNTVQGVKDAWDNTVQSVKDAWDSVIQWFEDAGESIKTAWNSTIEWFKSAWETIKTTAKTALDAILGFVTPIVDNILEILDPLINYFIGLWDNIKIIAEEAWNLIKAVIMAPILALIDIILGDWDQLAEDMGMIWESIKESAGIIWEALKDIVISWVTALWETAVNIFNEYKEILSGIWDTIVTFAKDIWSRFTTWFSTLIENTVNGITQWWEDLKQGAIDTWDSAIKWGKDLWNAFKAWFINLVKNTVSDVKQWWTDLRQGAIDTWNGAIQSGKDLWNTFKTWFINLIKNTVSDIKQWWQDLKDNTERIFNNIVNGAKDAWDRLVRNVETAVNNVQNVFDWLWDIDLWEIGKSIIDGFVNGLKNAWESGKEFIGNIGGWIRDNKGPIEYDRKLLIPAGKAIMDGLAGGLKNNFGKVKNTIFDVTKGLGVEFDVGLSKNSRNMLQSMREMSLSNLRGVDIENIIGLPSIATGGNTSNIINNVNNNFADLADEIKKAINDRPFKVQLIADGKVLAEIVNDENALQDAMSFFGGGN